MRDLRKGRKLGRERGQRKALLQSLAVQLIMHGKIKTTLPKAKEVRPYVERLVSYAKQGGVRGHRLVRQELPVVASGHLVKTIAPRFAERAGGYTRITRGLRRKGDAAQTAFIEFVG